MRGYCRSCSDQLMAQGRLIHLLKDALREARDEAEGYVDGATDADPIAHAFNRIYRVCADLVGPG